MDDENTDDRLDSFVCLNRDGSIIVIGATNNDQNGNESGHVRV